MSDAALGRNAVSPPSRHAVPAMSGAERVRRWRRRRQAGLHQITVELFEAEIAALEGHGLLDPAARRHPFAVTAATMTLLERAFAALDAGTLKAAP